MTNLKKLIKKGFTLVELVVVIAVIAILAGVSVVTYIGVTNNAKKSNDNTTLAQVNKTLVLREAKEDKKPSTMSEALSILDEDLGVSNVTKLLTATYGKHEFVYDLPENRFVLLEGNTITESFEGYTKTTTDGEEYNFWKFSSSIDPTDKYSHYCVDGYVADIASCSGVDTGNNLIENITYTNSEAAKKVVFNTNGGVFTVNAKVGSDANTSDKVTHFGTLDKLTINSNAEYSYHENGKVTFAVIKEGKVIAEGDSVIEVAFVENESAYAQEQDNGVINIAYASSESHENNNNTDTSKKELVYPDDIVGTKTGDEAVQAIEDHASNIVARIGKVGYEDLQVAFNSSLNNETIDLCKSFKINHGFLFNKDQTTSFDLNGYTLTVTGSNGNDGGRAIKITNGTLNISNGVIDGRSYNSDGSLHDNPSSVGPWSNTRTGGCVRLSGGDASITDVNMFNNDGWGNAVKVESDNHLTMTNCSISSVYGACMEVGVGTADVYGCTFKQVGLADKAFMSSCINACSFGTINLYNTQATMDLPEDVNTASGTYVLFVYNSGGIINVHGGQYKTSAQYVVEVDGARLCDYCYENASDATYKSYANKSDADIIAMGTEESTELISDYNAYKDAHNGKTSIVNVYSGNFVGKIKLANATVADFAVYGGTFNVDVSMFRK